MLYQTLQKQTEQLQKPAQQEKRTHEELTPFLESLYDTPKANNNPTRKHMLLTTKAKVAFSSFPATE